ncbi:maleylpyruvate isomerase family mycothiol-dependent enzyme [Solwaraspora sp. WMMB335]|uniref:maleylpyruvate isomerase family mycothiol-dependent enzyme n=1 Tax=Solwaraspora sp. WMMB335 TaxID=3404118 RepID=UPI003B92B55B
MVAERFRVVERIWRADEVAAAYAAEVRAALDALRAVPPVLFARPTRCAPWTVRELLAHIVIALSRTVEMLDGHAPVTGGGEPVEAIGYYAPDARFRPDVDGARVLHAQRWAAARSVGEAIDELARQAATVAARVAAEPADRLVVTRHGDLMTLTDFQVTRVVELAVHGVDLADGLGVASWLTTAAADLVVALAAGTTLLPLRTAREWDRAHLVRAVTGRAELSDADRTALRPGGVRSPFFGGTHRPTAVGEE